MELALDLSMHLTCYHNFLESGPLQIFVYSQSHDKMAKLMTSDLKARASAFSATMLSMLLEHSPGKQLCSIRADACCACVPSVRACGVKSASMLGTNLVWAPRSMQAASSSRSTTLALRSATSISQNKLPRNLGKTPSSHKINEWNELCLPPPKKQVVQYVSTVGEVKHDLCLSVGLKSDEMWIARLTDWQYTYESS